MSGGDFSGGSGAGDEVFDCASIFEKTILNSPKPDVLSKVKAGDVLTLELRQFDGRKSLVAVTNNKEIAGSITSATLSKIKSCMDQGFSYIAIVESIEGGRCTVLLRPETIL
ncbi:MAG: hypothetical protein CXR31_11705 [Geobacter sp.]|nr:MAG: hypothetical protein CXR31_11705 [Geobacter sp.]